MKLGTTLAAASIAVALAPSTAHASGEAKNVIFFLGDGMGPATVTASRIYRYGEAGRLTMETLPRTARIKTFSKNAQTTDSAPSMSAYMTGVKMDNDVISMSEDTKLQKPKCDTTNGKAAKTILELAKAAGKSVGAVTTAEATHATPAATYAHICNRDIARHIAVQAVPGEPEYNAALTDGLNVLMGGSQAHWLPVTPPSPGGSNPPWAPDPDSRNLFEKLSQGPQKYTVALTKEAFDAVDPSKTTKLVGIFSPSGHLDYELDRVKKATPAQPSLAEMTTKAIDVLVNASKTSGDKGFFLMVEGGRIDHALHATNAKRALADTIAFDEAIAAALKKVDLKNTLIVVTADHDHTMTINGYSRRAGATTAQDPGILGFVRDPNGDLAKDGNNLPYTILSFGNGPRRPDLRGEDDMKALAEDPNKPGTPLAGSGGALTLDPNAPAGGDPGADNYYQLGGVRTKVGSETHGGGDVMLMAGGAGSQSFKGTLDNTRVFTLLKEALGL
ncbi:alkaline phosphatase [Pendulispora albinea]|uniref:Alkaline phosphatase n=1 Tax=Pendulispora albinea TaxID=2741071 RepID=A0ABZ2LT46_9BACT